MSSMLGMSVAYFSLVARRGGVPTSTKLGCFRGQIFIEISTHIFGLHNLKQFSSQISLLQAGKLKRKEKVINLLHKQVSWFFFVGM